MPVCAGAGGFVDHEAVGLDGALAGGGITGVDVDAGPAGRAVPAPSVRFCVRAGAGANFSSRSSSVFRSA